MELKSVTTRPGNLKQHISKLGEKKYKCQECDYSTNWLSHLKSHKHIHNLAKSKQDDDQELKNTKEVFLCKICDLTFLTNMNLKKHNMKHSTNDQHYSCHLCTFSAEQSVNLEAHLLVRHAL